MEQLVELLPFLIPLIVLELALMVVALADLLRRERTRNLSKGVWILIVVFIQIFGPIAYFLAGREE